ncbi:hypothetical protein DMH17_07715 [Raoultella planticola]|nr:hypothetical protein [Raoultella planticola]
MQNAICGQYSRLAAMLTATASGNSDSFNGRNDDNSHATRVNGRSARLPDDGRLKWLLAAVKLPAASF